MPLSRLPRGRLLAVALLLAGAVLGAGACRAPAPDADGPGGTAAQAAGSEASRAGSPEAVAEPGPFAGDERVAGLLATWPDRVSAAAGRLTETTGLSFRPGAAPRVVLAPLGDEATEFALDTEVAAGRRRAVARVNLEPLAAGRREADAVLLGALAAAVYVESAGRGPPPPPWVVSVARLVATGERDAALRDLRRREVAAGAGAVRVDPGAPEAAAATALAALLVLESAGEAESLYRFLAFTAEGDEAGPLLARVVRDPSGVWAGAGRELLVARLAAVDPAPWTLVRRAEEALRDTGRQGLETLLEAGVPPEAAGQVALLRAEAALDEGQAEDARAVLAAVGPATLPDAADGARLSALRIAAERGPGGDPALAGRLAAWRRLDYPRAAADEEPAVSDVTSEAGLDVAGVRALAERLLADHRAGAARRLFERWAERGLPPEFADLDRRVLDAEASPSPEAVAAGRTRVAAWRAAPTMESAAAVRDGGAASAVALAEVLATASGAQRREGVRLLAEAGGAGRAVELLAPGWTGRPDRVAEDLDALLGTVRYAELRVWVDGQAADAVARAGGEALWERLRFGIDEGWVRREGEPLRDLRSPAYPLRRAAFDLAVAAGQATPDLVARALVDPAPLLRRAAVEVAGREGFGALVRAAFSDPAWVVRQAAAPAAVTALGAAAAEALERLLLSDPVGAVRRVAARSLLVLAGREPRLADRLLPGLEDPDAAVRDEVAAGLAGLDPVAVEPSVRRAIEAEARRRPLRPASLARLFVLHGRLTGRDAGYHPEMAPEEVDAVVRRLARPAPRPPPPAAPPTAPPVAPPRSAPR